MAEISTPSNPKTNTSTNDPIPLSSSDGASSTNTQQENSLLTKPQEYGDKAGNAIQSTLEPVGGPVGKGVEVVAKPVGNVVDGVVGGVMRSGAAFGSVVGAGGEEKEGK